MCTRTRISLEKLYTSSSFDAIIFKLRNFVKLSNFLIWAKKKPTKSYIRCNYRTLLLVTIFRNDLEVQKFYRKQNFVKSSDS